MADTGDSADSVRWGDHVASRRSLMRFGAGILAGTALGGGAIPDLVRAASPPLARATFESCVGARFKLHSVAGLTSLTLFKVRSLPHAPANGGESFSLLFRGPAAASLAQGVYTLEHRRTGRFAVLTVPMRPEPDARYYEIIFNRSAPG